MKRIPPPEDQNYVERLTIEEGVASRWFFDVGLKDPR